METRKVQLSGGSTYTVSLPKAWANEHGIDAGAQLFLYPKDDGSLHISTNVDATDESWDRELSAAHLSPAQVRERIMAMYVVGVETITLRDPTGIDDAVTSAVTETTDRFSGLELFGAGDTELTVKNLVGPETIDIRKHTLRLRLVTLAMHRDATTAVCTDDDSLAREVIERDSEADKLFAMLTRHFSRSITSLREVRQLGYSRRTLFEYYYVGRQLERVADHAERIARLVVETDAELAEPFREPVSELSERAQRTVEDASEVLLGSASVEAADGVLSTADDLLDDIEATDRDLYGHDDTAVAHLVGRLLRSLRRTVEYASNIARMMIQQSVRRSA